MIRYKENALQKVELIRQLARNANYLINTNSRFEDIKQSFDILLEKIDELEGIINLERDEFKTNQII